MDKKKLLRLGLLAPLLMTLSGCFQMDSTLRFAEGTVKPEIVMHISHQLASVDEEITVEEFRAFSGEKRQEFCETFLNSEGETGVDVSTPVPATSTTITEEGFDSEGWLICRATSDAVPISDLTDDSFTVEYTDGTYVVNSFLGDILGEASEDEVEISPSQLKSMGVEAAMTLAFTGEITNASIDGNEFSTETEPEGIILTNNSVTVDLLSVSGDLNVVGTDEVKTSVPNLTDLAPFLLTLLVILAGLFLLMRSKRKAVNKTSKTPSSPESSGESDDSLEESSTEEDAEEDAYDSVVETEEPTPDVEEDQEEDFMALAAQYDDPVDASGETPEGSTSDESRGDEEYSSEDSETVAEGDAEPVLLDDEDPELDALVAEYTRENEFAEASSVEHDSVDDEVDNADDEVDNAESSDETYAGEEDDEPSVSEDVSGDGSQSHGDAELQESEVQTSEESRDPRFEGNPFRKQ